MTNEAAMGYVLRGAKAAGLSRKQILLVLATMNVDMDLYSIEEAEERLSKFMNEE